MRYNEEYVPFDRLEEFIEASIAHDSLNYLDIVNKEDKYYLTLDLHHFFNYKPQGSCMWVKELLNTNMIHQVRDLDLYNNRCFILDRWVSLEEMFTYCIFLDGTPCGKVKEVNYEG